MTNTAMRQKLCDGAAVAASLACLVHCLAPPVAIMLLPALAAFFVLPDDFHVWAFLFAIPTSAAAMWIGHRKHRRTQPAAFALSGLTAMGCALLYAPTETIETALTVPGVLMLAIGHALNWRAPER